MNKIGILLAGATLCLTGCFTVEKAKLPGTEPGTHVMVRNYGKYFLNCVPIWCGNVNENPKCDFVMFRDDVTMDKMNHRFFVECNKLGKNVSDISYHTEDDIFFQLVFWNFSIPIPYILTAREIQITGVVK